MSEELVNVRAKRLAEALEGPLRDAKKSAFGDGSGATIVIWISDGAVMARRKTNEQGGVSAWLHPALLE